MADIKELYLQRKEAARKIKDQAQDIITKLLITKSEIEKKFIEKAKGDAEAYFNCAHAGELMEANQALGNAELELRLLRCPEERLHRKPDGQYYRCELCGDVWDDTSPAHF